jgi:diguanylate cyclase (GGDEF)-like protein/PAS domain S-box-containing protein
MSMTGAIITFTILRYKLLDLVPVAREALVERMADGLLVIDGNGRIVDMNAAARDLFDVGAGRPLGLSAVEVLKQWPEATRRLIENNDVECEFDLVSPDGRNIGVYVSPLRDHGDDYSGSLVILRDVTAYRQTEEALQKANDALQTRVAEVENLHGELREQAIRDPLTGLFNRRYLPEMLERELGRALREAYPVSMVMIDVDNFKDVNDEHGHAVGDLVLRLLGALLRSQTRPGDIACRYGGDEFLVVLPNTSPRDAACRAEELRIAVREASVPWLETGAPTTISSGVAAFPMHGSTAEEVMQAADTAVYAAKASGRDRVCVAGERAVAAMGPAAVA